MHFCLETNKIYLSLKRILLIKRFKIDFKLVTTKFNKIIVGFSNLFLKLNLNLKLKKIARILV